MLQFLKYCTFEIHKNFVTKRKDVDLNKKSKLLNRWIQFHNKDEKYRMK